MASSNVPEELLKKIDGQDRHVNAKTICCKICPSIILLPEKGRLISKPTELPHMSVKAAETTEDQVDSLSDFWHVTGMFTFENVGFSNAVNGIKYLICADCEQGPIGWCRDSDRETLYVAHDRVNYK